jgi:hypothetical protein
MGGQPIPGTATRLRGPAAAAFSQVRATGEDMNSAVLTIFINDFLFKI